VCLWHTPGFSAADDVTSGYIQLTVERLRQPMQAITDFMLNAAGVKESSVITMPLKKALKIE
jgi:hypothetical protein